MDWNSSAHSAHPDRLSSIRYDFLTRAAFPLSFHEATYEISRAGQLQKLNSESSSERQERSMFLEFTGGITITRIIFSLFLSGAISLTAQASSREPVSELMLS